MKCWAFFARFYIRHPIFDFGFVDGFQKIFHGIFNFDHELTKFELEFGSLMFVFVQQKTDSMKFRRRVESCWSRWLVRWEPTWASTLRSPLTSFRLSSDTKVWDRRSNELFNLDWWIHIIHRSINIFYHFALLFGTFLRLTFWSNWCFNL